MTYYLISFPSRAMDVPDEEFQAVGDAANAVVQEARAAGVLAFAGGLHDGVGPVLVAGDGTVTDGGYPEFGQLDGGHTIVDVPTRAEALEWAAKIAVACRCAQEVREFMDDPRR